MLTKRQKQILDFIKQYQKNKGYSPSLEEIGEHFKLSSVATVHEHLKNLESKGYLDKLDKKHRSIDVVAQETMVKIPLVGTIAAGQPIEAIQEKETIAIPKNKIPSGSKVFALQVAGNSMVEENIHDGDVVLVKQQSTAENGQKVVALIDNYDTTLKKYYEEKNQIRLQPANKTMESIIIRRNRDFAIQGVVLDVIRQTEAPAVNFPEQKEDKKRGKLPLNEIICEDVIIGLKKLPNESCDIIIIDPPYNIGKDFGNNIDKRELREYISWSKEWINESIRVLSPMGTLFIYGFSEILAYLSVEIPLQKRWLIWHYTNKNVASLNFWQRSHESIICTWKDKPIFNRDAVREPYTEGFLRGAAGKVRKGTIGRFSKNSRETVYNAHERGALPRDVIKIPALAGGAGMIERWFLCKTCSEVFEPRQLIKHAKHNIMKHPTQKPLELSRKLISSATPKKGGVVLVPFVGSGSECVAAKELGQSYVGFEIKPDYVRLAEKILKQTRSEQRLF